MFLICCSGLLNLNLGIRLSGIFWYRIRCLGSQGVFFESRPSCLGKTYPTKSYGLVCCFVFPFFVNTFMRWKHGEQKNLWKIIRGKIRRSRTPPVWSFLSSRPSSSQLNGFQRFARLLCSGRHAVFYVHVYVMFVYVSMCLLYDIVSLSYWKTNRALSECFKMLEFEKKKQKKNAQMEIVVQ